MLFQLWNNLGPLGPVFAFLACLILAIVSERFVYYLPFRGSSSVKKNLGLEQILSELKELQPKSRILFEELAEIRLNRVGRNLEKYLGLLKILATISPLIGLLGTIFGMITSFQSISANTGAVTPALVATGIHQALWTTALGLVLAIFSLVSHAIFKLTKERWIQDWADALSETSLAQFEES